MGKNKDKKGITLSMKVILNKCFKIDKNCVKNEKNEILEIDMSKAKEIIREANLASCHACNKSANMWADYYFTVRRLALENVKNISDDKFNELVGIEFNKKCDKVEDKTKLENENYKNKVMQSSIKKVKKDLLKIIEDEVIQKEYTDVYGKTYSNVIQGETKNIMKLYNTSNVGTLDINNVQNAFSGEKLDEILNYESSIPSYKKDTPYYFKNDNYNIFKNINETKHKKTKDHMVKNGIDLNKCDNSGYYVGLSLFSADGFSKYNLKSGTQLYFQIDKIDNSKKTIINNILNGVYKQGSASIRVSNKNKIELSISYSFIPTNIDELDMDRIMGVDLGINKVAVMSIWDNNKINEYKTKGDWEWLRYKDCMIDGEELIKYRQKQYNIKRKSQISRKYAGKGRVGHGTKTRVEGIYNDYVSNFSDTYNHKISKYIVDFAVKNKCGIIQMEDLTGVTSKAKETFLKEWSYYDLQLKIQYKAKQLGIEVVKVNPKYTSKRCSKCGCIHEDNRNCKENQGKFECQVCGHTENADINASKNIALPHIDEIIKNTEVIHSTKKAS